MVLYFQNTHLTSLDRASATTFLLQEICWMSVINSEMNDKCRCCLADQGSVTFDITCVIGLWSVNATKRRPSRKKRKCLIPRNNSNSSRSNALYLVSGVVNFLLKNANVCHLPLISCSKISAYCLVGGVDC